MTQSIAPRWHQMRTDETRMVENSLRDAGFEQVDAYRYNSASIRLRVIDSRFEGMKIDQRDAMVEPHIDKLPDETQSDIITLFTFAPSEVEHSDKSFRQFFLNAEFEDPSPSVL